MSPPLISDYKKLFTVKRIFQTVLGGPVLFAPALFLILQVVIFLFPAVILTLVQVIDLVQDPLSISCIVGGAILIMEILLNGLIIHLKRSSRVHTVPSTPSNHLAEEDHIYYRGLLHPSTWIFIAPNVQVEFHHLSAVICSTLSFALCTTLIIRKDTSILLRGFGLFSLCSARYSSVINFPPEIATFDAIRRKDFLYRPFYTFLIGFLFTLHSFFAEEVNYEWYAIALVTLPILWGFGILPPLDSFFPWIIELVLRVVGGSPSFFYLGSLIGLILVVFCTTFVFMCGQDHVLVIIIECIAGYFISCDAGLLLKLKASLCEDIPAKSFLVQIIKPTLSIIISLAAILLAVVPEILQDWTEVFMVFCLVNALSCWIGRKILLSLKTLPRKLYLIVFCIWDSLLMFILHAWISIEIVFEQKPRTLNTQSLIYLLMYTVTIRAFAQSILDPKWTTLDMTITTLCLKYAPDDILPPRRFTFTCFLLLTSLVRSRIARFFNYAKMMLIFFHATSTTPLLENKARYILISIAFLPISLMSLILTTFIEGTTLLPLFTLPIFLIGFPRPTSFFKERWLPKSKKEIEILGGNCLSNKILDSTIYSQISPQLTRGFLRKARKTRLKLEEGKCYIARFEDRLLFLRVITTSWNYIYIQIKGLEMQEQTSCHHQEAAWLDELLEKAFGNETDDNSGLICNLSQLFSVTKPKMTIPIATYVEAKSKLTSLFSTEDVRILRRAFFRSFSFLLLKNSPEFKRRPIATGFHLGSASPTFIHMFSDGNESDSTIECDRTPSGRDRDHTNRSKSKSKGIVKTIFNYDVGAVVVDEKNNYSTKVTDDDGESESDPLGDSDPDDDDNETGGPNNNLKFPYLPGMNTNTNTNTEPSSETTRRLSLLENKLNFQSLNISISDDHNVGGGDKSSRQNQTDDLINLAWVQKCLGTTTQSKLFQGKIERFCKKAWKLVMGKPNDIYEIDLSKFFKLEFYKEVKQLRQDAKSKGNIEELIVKAFRYASKLTLDEIYNSSTNNGIVDDKIINIEGGRTNSSNDFTFEEEIFDELTLYERDYKFCSPSEISDLIEQEQKIILSIDQNEKNESQMRIFRFENSGVEFKLAEISRYCVEGIWANLNLELLYLTSDDDERFSIQHDRHLMRNISNQCANSPLGYAVYDAVFRINQFDFSAERVA